MIKPPVPVDEYRRLETLRNLKLLDTPPEDRFDRVTRLAKRVFGTPIALVSLVDADRQWFKSKQGLDATETHREISFCGHAILEDRIMVVNDARNDERFCDNPLVTCDPNIRFYAGYPLNAPDGSKVGTLCIIDREPREMAAEDVALLRELGRMVEEELMAANLARNDPITGLATRIGLCLVAEHLLAMCLRNGSPASLMLFRFTNLQGIDGSMSHAEGDRAAVELSHILLASFRDSDVVARITTDVFAVLLAGSKLDDIDVARQRFADLLGERNRNGSLDYELQVESYAAAYNPARHASVEALIQEAEKHMHDADDSELGSSSVSEIQVESA